MGYNITMLNLNFSVGRMLSSKIGGYEMSKVKKRIIMSLLSTSVVAIYCISDPIIVKGQEVEYTDAIESTNVSENANFITINNEVENNNTNQSMSLENHLDKTVQEDNNNLDSTEKEYTPDYKIENVELEGEGLDITDELEPKIKAGSHTFIVKYSSNTPNNLQALVGISNNNTGKSDNYFDIFQRTNGELGSEIRESESKTNHLISRPAAVWGKNQKNEPVTNKIAFVSNVDTQTYSIYSNGTKIAESTVDKFKPINNISGINKYMLGGVDREGNTAFNFYGKIDLFEIYNQALPEEYLKEKTQITAPGKLIYKAGDSTGSNYFRIPVLYTFSNGRVFSAVDARYGGTHDFLNKINIATSYSDDLGETWSEPKLTMAFNDFANVPLDWPRDPKGRDLQISGGATYIDAAVVENPQNKEVIMMADVMPAGVSFRDALRNDSGFKDIQGKHYLKLKKEGDSDYNYTVREDGIIYDDRTNQKTEYKLEKDYTITKNGEYLEVEQYSVLFENNSKKEFHNGEMVNMSVFYKDALFKVAPTNYIGYVKSKDFGETWSELVLLPPLMGITRNSPYLGPGRGIVTKNNRLIFSSYTGKEVVYLYSDDNGQNWSSNVVSVPNGWSAETQMVELAPNVIQSYMRTNNGKIAFMTSTDNGNTWGEPKFLDFINNPKYGTQLSVINYSKKIDGKNVILLSTPNHTNGRRNGQIWIGLIDPKNNTVDWKYHKDVDYKDYGFSYSSLTELPNGDIGLFYEKFDSWARNELHMKNVTPYMSFTLKELIGKE